MNGYDAELQRHDEVLRRASTIQPRDHVLDIGCGAGHTTRWAARTARAGSALGVDVSAAAIDRARELARGLGNVAFEHADAQTYRFPPERFDVAISRFGTMFFADPTAAFANIRRALRPGGRLVMLVWQAGDRNEWDATIRESLGTVDGPDGGAFSLADPPTVTEILVRAGFAAVTRTDVREPVYYGADVATALDWVRGFRSTREVLDRLSPPAAAAAEERLRRALAARLGDDGVWFDSRAWIFSGLTRQG
jgi:SAM-dependent methyltransferase